MATEVKLPRLGQGMESGIIGKWLKAEGDRVEKGEPLYEVETDKATQEVEAEVSGVLLKIAVSEGEVPVGQTIAVIGEAGETVEIGTPAGGAAADGDSHSDEGGARCCRARARAAPSEPSPPLPVAGARTRKPNRTTHRRRARIKASPLARRMARERGIELAALTGTGPDGRIVAEDVEAARLRARRARGRAAVRARGARTPRRRFLPATSSRSRSRKLRKTIARRLTAAWEVPGVRAHRLGRHGPGERPDRACARAEPGRPDHGHRPAREGLRAGAPCATPT